MRTCTKCGLSKPLDEFYKTGKGDKRHGSCKVCHKKTSKATAKRLGRRHRKNVELQHHYGITIEDYDRMMDECEGKCVCGRTKARANAEALHVDHDHDTGLIRGLLCHSCNRTIGLTSDPDLLRKLADYIESANSRGFKGNGGRASGC